MDADDPKGAVAVGSTVVAGVFAGFAVVRPVVAGEDAVKCEDVFGLDSFVVFGLEGSIVGVVECDNAGLGGGSGS